MTSQGSPYQRFRRALKTGNLNIVRAAASELPQINLPDAVAVCALVAQKEPHRFNAAAVRWLARLCREQPDVTLEQLADATRALLKLPDAQAVQQLTRLAGR